MLKLTRTAIYILLLFALPVDAQKRQSDREFDGFRGAVKAVDTERADFKNPSKKSGETNRRRESEITYDKNGNRLTWKTYDYRSGALFDSVRYDVIDGERVSIYEKVDAPKLTQKISPVEPKPFDSRYTYKIKHEYDDKGNIIAESWFQNDGELWIKYVYQPKGNQKEELVYDKNGKLDQKILHIYDDRQNEIETIYYDVKKNAPDGREVIEYVAFDAGGNWTRRIVSESDDSNLSVVRARETMYRTITYY